MDITDLNISIDLFETKEQLERFLALAGYSESQRNIIFEKFKGVVWSQCNNGEFALFLHTLTVLDIKVNEK